MLNTAGDDIMLNTAGDDGQVANYGHSYDIWVNYYALL